MGRFKAAGKLVSKAWWTLWEGEQDTKAVAIKTDDAPSPFKGWQFGVAVTAGVLFAGLFIVGLATNHDLGGWIGRLFHPDWWQAVGSIIAATAAVVAAVFLKQTLDATRKMANEQLLIGRIETEAALEFAKFDQKYDPVFGDSAEITIINKGRSQAKSVRVKLLSQQVKYQKIDIAEFNYRHAQRADEIGVDSSFTTQFRPNIPIVEWLTEGSKLLYTQSDVALLTLYVEYRTTMGILKKDAFHFACAKYDNALPTDAGTILNLKPAYTRVYPKSCPLYQK